MESIQTEKLTIKGIELQGHYSDDKSAFWVNGGNPKGSGLFSPEEINHIYFSGYSFQILLKNKRYPKICLHTGARP